MSRFDLDTHLKEEHRISPISTYLKEIVYGGNDGIVTTFAVVAGFTGAQAQVSSIPVATVLLFGFANLFADGVSMSLGNFLSNQSEKDVYKNYKNKEHLEIRKNPHLEKEETMEILRRKGFGAKDAETLVKIYSSNERYWLDFMMEKELEIPNPENEHAGFMALATFVSFTLFGLIPLLPYVFLGESPYLFTMSIGATAVALLILGILRAKVTQRGLIRPIAETLLLGGAAAFVAFFVGTMFQI